ncbi:Gag protein [Phytophthora palmivora]|uniref:Gag protein n=1 Tax=Phytophthora palmivora TaxID=4796 RepID=A0A2P4WZY4_9STRA|nr:Gag protein [Phytophthora palmivora]
MDRGEFPHLTDSQFESVRKMVGIFGGDALRSLAAATPAEQAPVAEMKPAQPKPLRLKVSPYEGKEGENLHLWVREVKLAMDAALISTERLRVAFALSNLGDRAKTWAYRREATTPDSFTTWAQLCQQLRAAFLPANYEYRQRSRFLACKQGKRELYEYIQEMRVLVASLEGNPLPEHIKVTVFMDGLKVGPSRTQLFRVHANTVEEMIQIAPQRSTVTDRLVLLRRCSKDTMRQQGRQEAYASEEAMGVADFDEGVAMILPTGRETKAHCQAPDGTDQAGNIDPQAAEAAEESAEVEEDAKSASGVGNIVPHKVEETKKKIESAACVSSVGNRVPRGVKKTSSRAEVSLSTSGVDNQAPHSESETPPARPVEEQCHVFDGVSGRQVRAGAVHLEALPEVSATANLEELSMKDFLAVLEAGEIAEMVLLKPETSPEDLNSSSVMDEDVLEGFTKQRATHLGSEILKNPENSVQWPLPREQSEVIDAFFAENAKSGMVRESKSPHSTPTFCVRKPNGKWRLVRAYSKLNNVTVPTQTPIPRKNVLLNNMSGCTLYRALDLVDGYYQILMRESDIPLRCSGSG